MLKIFSVKTDKDLEIIKELLEEYLAWRESEMSIFSQESEAFQRQLSELPAEFVPPKGCLLIAKYDGKVAGCVGLRDLGDDICEMKRLYVTPTFRRRGIGKDLAKEVIEQARKIGYVFMRIDTFDNMAKELYTSLGFNEIEPYRHNPIKSVAFMELKLV